MEEGSSDQMFSQRNTLQEPKQKVFSLVQNPDRVSESITQQDCLGDLSELVLLDCSCRRASLSFLFIAINGLNSN